MLDYNDLFCFLFNHRTGLADIAERDKRQIRDLFLTMFLQKVCHDSTYENVRMATKQKRTCKSQKP
jgi:hypothetical protein